MMSKRYDGDPDAQTPSGRPVLSDERYEILWQLYRDGERSMETLANTVGIGVSLVKKYVNYGAPRLKRKSLKQRLLDANMTEERAKELEAAQIAKKDAEMVSQARQLSLNISNAAKSMVAKCLRSVSVAAETMTFERKVKSRVGNTDGTITYGWLTLPPNGVEVTAALKSLVESLRWLAANDAVVLGRDEQKQVVDSLNKAVRAHITPEQLDHIAKTGQLPDGISEADLLAYDPSASARHN